MQKRAFIIHGWDGYPEEGWFPWLKKELEKKGFKTATPAMPNSLKPKIKTWVNFLSKQIGIPDENTFLIGHSMGARTIIRYLESLPKNAKIGGVTLVAGGVHLNDTAYECEEDKETARPWIETPINWGKVKTHTDNFVCVFSDNDPYIPLQDAEIFKEKLSAKIIIEHNKKHFSGCDGIYELQSVFEVLKY